MSGIGSGGFAPRPTYYLVPTQTPTALVATVNSFGQRGWSVAVPVQPPTPRVVVMQPQPPQYVQIAGSEAQMAELRQAVASGRPVQFVQVSPPVIQPQAPQSVLPREPLANEPTPVAIETGVEAPRQALAPVQGEPQPAVMQEPRGREMVRRAHDRGPGPVVEDVSDPESPRPTEQPTATDLDFDLHDAAKRLLCAGFGQIMGKFSLPEDFSIGQIKEVMPRIKHYADCAEQVGDASQRQNGRELLEAARTAIDPDVN